MDQSLTKTFHKPQWQMSALLVVIAAVWIAAYNLIQPFANWLTYSLFRLDSVSRLGESIAFFLYDVPKILLLLSGMIFLISIIRTFFSPERTRAVLGDKDQPPLTAGHNQIERVIAVMSGKGGVGKSLVTGLLATALVRAGHRVGILDADITGPSIPKLFGVRDPLQGSTFGVEPAISRLGISLMSINFLLQDEEQAVIWRGPLISGAIQQFWGDVHWGRLDELLVDLPPGTSDAALTVMQSLPINGVLMITTPQELASMVVRKAVKMAQAVNVPIIGVIENMAGFVAPDTGRRYDIFGPSHADEVAALAEAPVLARLPIDTQVAALCDAGKIEEVVRPELDAVIAALKRL